MRSLFHRVVVLQESHQTFVKTFSPKERDTMQKRMQKYAEFLREVRAAESRRLWQP